LIRQADIRGQQRVGNEALLQNWTPKLEITVREALERADSEVGRKFADRPLVEAAIRLSIAETFRGVGQVAKAFENAQRALQIRVERLGEDDPLTAKANLELANCLDDSGKYAEAYPLHQKALALYIELLGEKHVETARAYNNLATNLRFQAKYADSQSLYQKALDVRRELLDTYGVRYVVTPGDSPALARFTKELNCTSRFWRLTITFGRICPFLSICDSWKAWA
jgi:tetratricopeptide (TPR) repeat protein